MRTTFLIVILTAFYSVSSALAAPVQDRVQGTFLGCRLGEDFRSVSNPERWECRAFCTRSVSTPISPTRTTRGPALNLPRGIPPFSALPIQRLFPRGERPGFSAESPRSGNTWSSPPRTCSGTEPRRASLLWGCTGIFPRTPVWTRSCSSISAITT